MDDKEVGRYWEENAGTWIMLSRMGFDIYRDHFNSPAFLKMLPDVKGLSGLDLGCGEGHNTRLVASVGARMQGIDISKTFIRYAIEKEEEEPLGIKYLVQSAAGLPFPQDSFDFVVAFMSFMDMPELAKVLEEAHRVLRPGGFMQFSITHPCFTTPYRKWVDDSQGKHIAMACGDYFNQTGGALEEWIFHRTPARLKARLKKFRVPRFHRILSDWFNLVIKTGFRIEHVHEPKAGEGAVRRIPELADTHIIAHFLHIRCRKPKEASGG